MDFVSPDDGVFLSTMPASRSQRRLALAVVLIATVLFLVSAPFAKVQLQRVDGFIPAYETAIIMFDLITAILLFGQFAFLRSRAILVLASGYLFTSTMTLAHALSFPGLFAPQGLLGAGPQTTVWLYVFWHVGFALFVIALVRPLQRCLQRRLPQLLAVPLTAAGALLAIGIGCWLIVWGFGQIAQWIIANG